MTIYIDDREQILKNCLKEYQPCRPLEGLTEPDILVTPLNNQISSDTIQVETTVAGETDRRH